MVEIKGAVFRPGMYQVDGNIATIRQLIENAGGFTEDAIRTRGILHRRKADRSLEVVALDLEGIHNHTSKQQRTERKSKTHHYRRSSLSGRL